MRVQRAPQNWTHGLSHPFPRYRCPLFPAPHREHKDEEHKDGGSRVHAGGDAALDGLRSEWGNRCYQFWGERGFSRRLHALGSRPGAPGRGLPWSPACFHGAECGSITHTQQQQGRGAGSCKQLCPGHPEGRRRSQGCLCWERWSGGRWQHPCSRQPPHIVLGEGRRKWDENKAGIYQSSPGRSEERQAGSGSRALLTSDWGAGVGASSRQCHAPLG